MPNLIAGWLTFWLLVWHILMIAAPIVADAYPGEPVRYQHICPYPHIKHGIGSDLRTYTLVRDVCGSARLTKHN